MWGKQTGKEAWGVREKNQQEPGILPESHTGWAAQVPGTVTEVAAVPALNPSKRSGLLHQVGGCQPRLEPTGGGGAEAKEIGNSRDQCEEETRQGGCCSGQDSSTGLR